MAKAVIPTKKKVVKAVTTVKASKPIKKSSKSEATYNVFEPLDKIVERDLYMALSTKKDDPIEWLRHYLEYCPQGVSAHSLTDRANEDGITVTQLGEAGVKLNITRFYPFVDGPSYWKL